MQSIDLVRDNLRQSMKFWPGVLSAPIVFVYNTSPTTGTCTAVSLPTPVELRG